MKLILRALALLLLSYLTEAKQKDFYTFKVVNSRGRLVSLEKYRGSVSLALFWMDSLTNEAVHAGRKKTLFFIYIIYFASLSFSPRACMCIFECFLCINKVLIWKTQLLLVRYWGCACLRGNLLLKSCTSHNACIVFIIYLYKYIHLKLLV